MKIGYVILAHRHPHLAARLARLLVETGGVAAIHYDAGAGAAPVEAMKAELGDLADRVRWAERVRAGWGEWPMIEATLNGVETLLTLPEPPDYIQLLSGADFPIRPLADYAAFLTRHSGAEFIESHAENATQWVTGGLSRDRYRYRHYFNWKKHPKLFDWNYRMQRALGLKRRLPEGMEPHFGSQWCTLTRQTWRDIVELARRPDILAAFRHSWIPDEMFLQTLVAHLGRPPRNGTLTLHQFDDKGVPIVYHDDHADYLAEQPFFFARKVSPHASNLRDRLEAVARAPASATAIEDREIGRRTAEYRDFCIANKQGRAGRRVVGRTGEEGHDANRPRKRNADDWYGELAWNRIPYLVLVGRCFEELRLISSLLDKTPGIVCHGGLFAAGEAEFAGGAECFAGYRRRDVPLRDHNRETFLSDVIHAAGERRTGFIHDWTLDERPRSVPLWDRRARFVLVSGDRLRAWLEGKSGPGRGFQGARFTPSHFRDWQELDRSWHCAVEAELDKANARHLRLDLLAADWPERLERFLECLELPGRIPKLDRARAREAAQHLSKPTAVLADAGQFYAMIADPAVRRAHEA